MSSKKVGITHIPIDAILQRKVSNSWCAFSGTSLLCTYSIPLVHTNKEKVNSTCRDFAMFREGSEFRDQFDGKLVGRKHTVEIC